MPERTEVGKRLRLERLKRFLTQEDVAKAIGTSKMAICSYEIGDRTPRDEIKVKLAQFYETTVESLFFT